MNISSRQGLRDFCLRKLGAPVIEINVAAEQLEDRLDEALEFFSIYHYEGIERLYLKHEIVQADLDNKYIPIPDYVMGVVRVLPIHENVGSRSMFDVDYQFRLHNMHDLTSTNIIYYNSLMEHLSMLDLILNGHQHIRYNRFTEKLYVDLDWSKQAAGNIIVVECYRALDPTEAPRMFGDPWLIRYTTALFKQQWASNLKKFSGMQLPGGVTIDGDSLYQEANTEIEALEEELRDKSAPLEWFTG